jgi:hypothetical protein
LSPRDEQSVFLNVPFDLDYSPLFLALIAGLTGLGRKPRCAVEVTDSGGDRLDRIVDLLTGCGASIHDLSWIALYGEMQVPRFNIPFELGLACSMSRGSDHRFFVFEAREHRLRASLSDLNGYDPQIHEGTQEGVLGRILDCFGSPSPSPTLDDLERITEQLTHAVAGLQRQYRRGHPFQPFIYRQTVQAAADLAKLAGLID